MTIHESTIGHTGSTDSYETLGENSDSFDSTGSTYAIETTNLSYVFKSKKIGLQDIDLKIRWGTTNLLVGPNGAGKSTLLKILAGKTLINKGSLKIGGFDPFEFSSHNSDINKFITYLGTDWATNSMIKRDIPVNLLLASIGGELYADRRNKLIEILDIDPSWSMINLSDGERRRVQIAMGLVKPWKLLLLDEVTIDLDVIVRQHLLNFLKSECHERGCCVIYATHIFDGLGQKWCDRLIHLDAGLKLDDVKMKDVRFTSDENAGVSEFGNTIEIPMSRSIHPLALHWLDQDLARRGTRAEEREKMINRHNDWNNARDGNYFDGDDDKIKKYFMSTRSNV
jgi:CCR4-NOT complex subunit CAF16